MKGYKLIFKESGPQLRPGLDRSPTNLRRKLNNNSPNSNQPNNVNVNGNSNSNANAATGSKPTVTATTTTMTPLPNLKNKSDFLSSRNALNSAYYRRSTTNLLSEPATSSNKPPVLNLTSKADADLTSQSMIAPKSNSNPGDASKPKYVPLTSRTRTQLPLNTLELKPSTVEGM